MFKLAFAEVSKGKGVVRGVEDGEANLRVLMGGKAKDGFVEPTIIEASLDDKQAREEIFGPVLCAMTFDDTDLDRNPANFQPLTPLTFLERAAEVYPDRVLAIDPGSVGTPLDGVATKEPAFGLPATWIPADQRDSAAAAGFTAADMLAVLQQYTKFPIPQNLPLDIAE